MGCSSSALNTAGDSSGLRREESESCFAQPKPRTLGKESTLFGKVEKESPAPFEKLKISAVSTANGVKPVHEWPLANSAADPPASTEEAQPLDRPEESGPPQPGGKDDTLVMGGKKKDMGAVAEAQPLQGNAETESGGTDLKYTKPLRATGERSSPGAVEGTENPQTARQMKLLGTSDKIPPLEAAREPQPQEAMGKGEQTQLPETVPKEKESPEVLEGSQFLETAGEQQLQETLGKDEQSQPLETIPRENGTPEISEGSQFVGTAGERQLQEMLGKDEQSQPLETNPRENETPEVLEGSQFVGKAVNSELLHKTPEGPRNMEQSQLEGMIVGSMEHPVGILEIGANMEMVKQMHTNEEDQHIEGETGEKVETEAENEKGSEGPGTKEEETGEAVGLAAAT
ncbi:glutamate-rich protein 5 isoform X2 [Mustela lutreola]|uniref:glutamate-rich protein 5 isoform X2 n=1 Tax=Mustela lutreola TaxID=9666 RepID=UPI002797B48A|nr:glutamate-rich protein 5 isoform X2 [Mustela lutreola]